MYGQIWKPIWINEDWCAAEKKRWDRNISPCVGFLLCKFAQQKTKKTIRESVKRLVINNTAHVKKKKKKKKQSQSVRG